MSQVGVDLAKVVVGQNLPVVESDRLSVYRHPFELLLDASLFVLSKRMLNSPLLVGGEPQLANDFLNTLAVRLSYAEEIESYMVALLDQRGIPYPERIARLVGKRLHTFNAQQFFSLSSDANQLRQHLLELIDESDKKGFIWVVDRLQDIFAGTKSPASLTPVAQAFNRAVHSAQLTFIAPLSWDVYTFLLLMEFVVREKRRGNNGEPPARETPLCLNASIAQRARKSCDGTKESRCR